MKSWLSTAVIFMMFPGVSAVQAATFNFRVMGAPVIESTTCDDFAFSEAQRLEAMTRGKTWDVHAACFEDEVLSSYAYWNYVISYSADKPLNLVSTIDGFSSLAPGYQSKKDCEDALAGEAELFAKLTGVSVFQQYCKVPAYSSVPWMLTVEGFGLPEVRPFSSSTPLYGTPIGYNELSFAALLRQRLLNYGSTLAQLKFSQTSYSQSLAIRYYGLQRIRVEETPLAVYADTKLCLADVAGAEQGLVDTGAVTIGTYCHKAPITGKIELVSLTNGQQGFRFAKPDVRYKEFSQCQASKAGVIAHYVTNLARDIKAGLCSVDRNNTGAFQLILIERSPGA